MVDEKEKSSLAVWAAVSVHQDIGVAVAVGKRMGIVGTAGFGLVKGKAVVWRCRFYRAKLRKTFEEAVSA